LQAVDEARVTETDTGRVAEGEGWFVLNAAEASWERDHDNGVWCGFEATDGRTEGFGIGVHVLEPGQPNGRYHSESVQEGFLVLSGECLAIVEGEELPMRQWDYLHCPPGTDHILVGAGDGPCAILMVGVRSPDNEIRYSVSELAARYGASVKQPTSSPKEAYADLARTVTRERAPWPPGN
jgi:uncharacterized cupin superfamily protein